MRFGNGMKCYSVCTTVFIILLFYAFATFSKRESTTSDMLPGGEGRYIYIYIESECVCVEIESEIFFVEMVGIYWMK